MSQTTVKGFKVTNSKMQCRGYQYELNKEFTHTGKVDPCNSGFHFCEKAADCFGYYNFNSENRVFEIEGGGLMVKKGNKTACSKIKFIREIPWHEVLTIVNSGSDNTGLSNSGDWNSGNRNSGNRNSGDWNSGDSNSGYSNSGNWNSGNRNSGDWNSGNSNSGYSNSGNWNSGNRNSGDSNSGYRSAGAFCASPNPTIFLFDKPTNITAKEWESSKACQIMSSYLENTIWVPSSLMSDKEKEDHPHWETTEGYLKTISLKEAWANMWPKLDNDYRKVFTDLPNFDASKFKEITGIDVNA